MKKTKNLITKILLESGGRLNLSQIMKKMQDEDHIITDDTLAKNLQEMTKSGYLRYEKEKEEVEYYSYNLSKENRLKWKNSANTGSQARNQRNKRNTERMLHCIWEKKCFMFTCQKNSEKNTTGEM